MTTHTDIDDSTHIGVVIRSSRAEDRPALARLAELDGRSALDGEHVLVAEVGGDLVAALPLDGGKAVADPFRPTAALVDLLTLRARQLRDGVQPSGGLRRRISRLLRPAPHPPAMAQANPGNAALLIVRNCD